MTHHKTTKDPTFRGVPVFRTRPDDENRLDILENLHELFQRAVSSSRPVLFFLIKLRLSDQVPSGAEGQAMMTFMGSLVHDLRHNGNFSPTDLWARQQAAPDEMPHYDVCLLLDGGNVLGAVDKLCAARSLWSECQGIQPCDEWLVENCTIGPTGQVCGQGLLMERAGRGWDHATQHCFSLASQLSGIRGKGNAPRRANEWSSSRKTSLPSSRAADPNRRFPGHIPMLRARALSRY